MISPAILLALSATVLWGFWTITVDRANQSNHAVTTALGVRAVATVFGVVFVTVVGEPLFPKSMPGLLFAVGGGVAAGVAGISLYTAIQRGRVALVTTLGSLYFVVAAIIGVVFLGQTLAVREWIGVGVAMVAVVLFSYSDLREDDGGVN